MTEPRPGTPGATRTCPHCRERILESAAVCPACRHHLRYEPAGAAGPTHGAVTPLRVEGSFHNPAGGETCEYSMVLTIRDQRGDEIARRVVGVGAMQPDERCTFTLSVEVAPRHTIRAGIDSFLPGVGYQYDNGHVFVGAQLHTLIQANVARAEVGFRM